VRRLLSPRWLALHALAVVMAATCLALGWWQWRRGQAGNARSFAYALEWPTFAIFILFMWGRMIYDELRPPASTSARPASPTGTTAVSAPPPGPVAVPGPEAAVDPDEDPELTEYNRYLAELNARAERYRR
jgi:DNA-binding transcriptional regulator of glucitol operon